MAGHARRFHLPADAIAVHQFREILIWPLALDLRPPPTAVDEVSRAVDAAASEIGPPWARVDDPSRHVPLPADGDPARWDADRYAEAVYFHEFVQRFLFAARKGAHAAGDQPPFHLFRRRDIQAVAVTLAGGSPAEARTVVLDVERVNLYLFCTGAAILVLEVRARPEIALAGPDSPGARPLHLSDVQDFHEQFRRTFIPFAAPPGVRRPGLVVRQVTWGLANGKASETFQIDDATLDDMIRDYLNETDADPAAGPNRRSPPLFAHWRWLLSGALPLASRGPGNADGTCWRPVMDERMPTLVTVSVTPADGAADAQGPLALMRATCDEDLIRLCYADGAGSAAYLYDVDTRAAFRRGHVYSVFRDSGTLFLVSGYAFVAYGAGGFFDDVVAGVHMRRHYFQIGLLAHLELASLLSFSSRITRAVEACDRVRPEEFARMMRAIEGEYLQFIHRFRFTGASNHLQAQQLTAMWRRHLRLAEIFEDLHMEITSATRYLFNCAASDDARMVKRLTIIGTFGLVGALTFSFLGMNILVQPAEMAAAFHYLMTLLGFAPGRHDPALHPVRLIIGEAAAFSLALAVLALSASVFLRRVQHRTEADSMRRDGSGIDRSVTNLLWWIVGGAGLAAVLGFGGSVLLWVR